MQKRGYLPAILVSLTVNISTLAVLHFFFHLPNDALEQIFAIDSIVAPEERKRDDFEKQLDKLEKPATTFNITPGAVSSKIGGRSKTIRNQIKVQPPVTTNLSEPTFTPSDRNFASAHNLGEDLGESEVNGDAQVLVKGYGAALHIVSQELLRMMRNDRLLVVWLFDESESMKDDQEKIAKSFGRIYEELKIVDREAARIGISKKLRRKYGKKKSLLSEIMLTSVASFGKVYHQQTKKPTSKVEEILSAIGRIPIDDTGVENTCAAIISAIGRHRAQKIREKRKLVIIVVSDESGDDGNAVDDVIRHAKSAKSPIYVLGRESVFGSKYAYVRWTQRETGRRFYLPVRRGPETPFPELLAYDGFRRRYDSHMSGFGPYDQTRLCRDTGGIFLQLPHEDTNLNDINELQYAAKALRKYRPNLSQRSKYLAERNASKFRKTIAGVIDLLDPEKPSKTIPEIPDPALQYEEFTTVPSEFGQRTRQRGNQIQRILAITQRAIRELEGVKSERAREPSARWRANYDLILAQLYWYQIRLFEYGIGMDQFVRNGIAANVAKNPKHNRWRIRETGRKLVLPDELNAKRFKVTAEGLKQFYEDALARFKEIQKQHPETPWASRAEWETRRPIGVTFQTFYRPPPPKRPPPTRPRPKPTPPPKL